ncbi:unnamed protein product [Gordionus sp. m RMFG-2023]|uniref:uncharacterized protein ZK1073.1-like n=1 Tax=Gordionus sp. m RMFG-2023 TaxID=3053472 RepID=UPI0030E10FD4
MDNENKIAVQTSKGFPLNVFFHGPQEDVKKHPVILTVHDIGSNHTSFHPFIYHSSMQEVRKRASFIEVDILGQGENDPALPTQNYRFPSLQELGESLVSVLDAFNVHYVIGLGEGAGANILARFAMAYPVRCMGLCLIHCTSTTAGVMEYFKDKIISWKLDSGMNPTAEQYLIFHKFGSEIEAQDSKEGREELIQSYAEALKKRINPQNLRYFLESFLNRTDISTRLEKDLTVDCLLVTATKGSHLHTIHTMHSFMNKQKSSLLQINEVGDVINEAPEKLAEGFIFFLKGTGYIPALPMPHSQHGRASRISMVDADKPDMRRYSRDELNL